MANFVRPTRQRLSPAVARVAPNLQQAVLHELADVPARTRELHVENFGELAYPYERLPLDLEQYVSLRVGKAGRSVPFLEKAELANEAARRIPKNQYIGRHSCNVQLLICHKQAFGELLARGTGMP